MTTPKIICCRGNVFTKPLPSNNGGIDRQTYRLFFDTTWSSQKTMRPTILPFLCVFTAARTCFSKPLPSNDKGWHIQTHRLMGTIYEVRRWDGLRCHDILVHAKFYKDRFRHSKVDGGEGIYIQTHAHTHIKDISLTYLFLNNESRQKMVLETMISPVDRRIFVLDLRKSMNLMHNWAAMTPCTERAGN
jgi:hypothetical protein